MNRSNGDKFGLKEIFGNEKKGKTKKFIYNSRFKSQRMVLSEFQNKIDSALKNGPVESIKITEELKKKYERN